MSDFTDYLENALCNHLRGGTPLAQPAALYVGLFSTATTDAGGGTELSGAGYAREAVAFGAPSGGVIANTGQVQFQASGGNWPSVTHAAVFDAASGGNMLWHGALTTPKQIDDGDLLNFNVGQMTFQIS